MWCHELKCWVSGQFRVLVAHDKSSKDHRGHRGASFLHRTNLMDGENWKSIQVLVRYFSLDESSLNGRILCLVRSISYRFKNVKVDSDKTCV